MQAQRLLMEARAGISAPATNGIGAAKAAEAGDRGGGAAAPSGPDPRLRAPERHFTLVSRVFLTISQAQAAVGVCVCPLLGWLRTLLCLHCGLRPYALSSQPAFKPGTATWNTDDPDQQPWLKNKKPKHGAKKEPPPPELVAPPPPTAYLTSAKLTKSIYTTGK